MNATKKRTAKPRFLHVPVTPALLTSINVAAARQSLTVRAFVVTILEKNVQTKGAKNGKPK